MFWAIVFSFTVSGRDRAAYMAPVVSRESRSPKKRYVKRKQPPTPPKINIRLTSVPREKVGKITPKDEDEESPSKKSHAVSTVVPADASEASEDSENVSSPSPLSVDVKTTKEELDAAGFHAACFVGILNDPKSTSRAMSKTPKKTVKRGVLEFPLFWALSIRFVT